MQHIQQPPSINEEEQCLLYQRTPTPLCRICYDDTGELIKCCKCSGTQGLVHRKCLRKWVENYATDKDICEICKSEWSIELYTFWESCKMKCDHWCMFVTFYINLASTVLLFEYCVNYPKHFGPIYYWIFTQGIVANYIVIYNNEDLYSMRLITFMVWYICLFIYLVKEDEPNSDIYITKKYEWKYITNGHDDIMWFITLLELGSWALYIVTTKCRH